MSSIIPNLDLPKLVRIILASDDYIVNDKHLEEIIYNLFDNIENKETLEKINKTLQKLLKYERSVF